MDSMATALVTHSYFTSITSIVCRYILVVFNEGFMLPCYSSVKEIRFVYCHCGDHFSCLPLFRYVHCSIYIHIFFFWNGIRCCFVDVQTTIIATSITSTNQMSDHIWMILMFLIGLFQIMTSYTFHSSILFPVPCPLSP